MPSVWSSSASVSSTASTGVVRSSCGCSPEKASIWSRTSGEALTMNHRRRSAVTATDDWVRAEPAPERTATHTGQPQFHCGEPPPAAEPNTRSNTPALRSSTILSLSPARPSVAVPGRRAAPDQVRRRPTSTSPPTERRTWSPRPRLRSRQTRASPTQRAETPWIHLLSARTTAGSGHALRRFREGEDDQGASVPRAEHAGEEPLGPPAPADRHGDVLPAVDHVGGRVAVVAASALELPQLLPGAGVERVELPGGFTGEHQVTAGGQYRGAHREFVAPAPLLLAACVERADGSAHVLDVHLNARAPVRNALLELPAPSGGRGAGVLDRDVEESGLRAVGRVGPFLGAGRTRVEVDRFSLLVRVHLGRHLAVPRDRSPRDAVYEGGDLDPRAVCAVEDEEVAVLVEVPEQFAPVLLE